MMMRVCMCVRGRVYTGACEYVVLLFLLLFFFTLEGPPCKLDWYMQYFINAVCTFLSNCVTFVK